METALERAARGRGAAVAAGGLAVALVAACVVAFGVTGRGLVASYLCVVLVVLSLIDLRERRLPNRIVLPSAAAVLAAQIALEPGRALEWTLAALGAALFLFVPILVYPAGMGMGDVKLALLLGAALGTAVVPALVIGLLASFVVGVGLIAARGLRARKAYIPFGPFLAFGAITALFVEAI
ncbi:MAG: prepilin peptidase [Thermoleophilia bacterium]|nr:prepilin peptidase [Thermoleophilia bacterium]